MQIYVISLTENFEHVRILGAFHTLNAAKTAAVEEMSKFPVLTELGVSIVETTLRVQTLTEQERKRAIWNRMVNEHNSNDR